MTVEEARELKTLTDAIVENLRTIREDFAFVSDGEGTQARSRKGRRGLSAEAVLAAELGVSVRGAKRAKKWGATLKRGAATQVMTYPRPESKSVIVEASRRAKLSVSSFMVMASLKEANRMDHEHEQPRAEKQELLSDYIAEAVLASELHKTVRTLRRWHATDMGPPRTLFGKAIYYRKSSVSEWLKERGEGTTGNANDSSSGDVVMSPELAPFDTGKCLRDMTGLDGGEQ
jgi:hypothetical protein